MARTVLPLDVMGPTAMVISAGFAYDNRVWAAGGGERRRKDLRQRGLDDVLL